MTDIDRAIKLLASPIEADRRKAIKLLAEIGTTEAYEYIGVAYKSEQDPDIRALMVKAGKYIKAQQTTFTTPPVKAEKIDEATSYETQFIREYPQKTSTTIPKTTQIVKPRISTRDITFIIAFFNIVFGVMLLYSIYGTTWVKFDSFKTANGTRFGDEIQEIQNQMVAFAHNFPVKCFSCLLNIDARFDFPDVLVNILGLTNGWRTIFRDNNTYELTQQVTQRSFPDIVPDRTLTPEDFPLEGLMALFLVVPSIIAIIFGLNNSLKLLMRNRILFIHGGLFSAVGILTTLAGIAFAILQMFGFRLMWLLTVIGGILVITCLIFFYFSMLPRFVPMTLISLQIPPQPYHLLTLLDTGYLLAWIAGLGITIVNAYPIARYGF